MDKEFIEAHIKKLKKQGKSPEEIALSVKSYQEGLYDGRVDKARIDRRYTILKEIYKQDTSVKSSVIKAFEKLKKELEESGENPSDYGLKFDPHAYDRALRSRIKDNYKK